MDQWKTDISPTKVILLTLVLFRMSRVIFTIKSTRSPLAKQATYCRRVLRGQQTSAARFTSPAECVRGALGNITPLTCRNPTPAPCLLPWPPRGVYRQGSMINVRFSGIPQSRFARCRRDTAVWIAFAARWHWSEETDLWGMSRQPSRDQGKNHLRVE